MHNYDLDRVASKARSIEYESDISRAKNLSYEMMHYINSADCYIIRMENDLATAKKRVKKEEEKNEILTEENGQLTEENRQLKEQLEQANRLNEFLTAKLALKDIYSRSGSEWYSNEGCTQAKNMRIAIKEFGDNNKIDSKEFDNIDFNSIYGTLEEDNQKNRDAKRKIIVITIMQQAAKELSTELLNKAEEQINLIADANIKNALLDELSRVSRKVNSKIKGKEIVNNVKKLFKSK
jgi:hypothetical protein